MTDPTEKLRRALADRYTIERELGAGGMATVYLSSDLKNRRKVAVKVLRSGLSQGHGRDRFLREIEIVANLAHPHILPLHDSGTIDDMFWFASPYVDGETLRDRIDREGQLPLEEALRITSEVADALDYAHEHGLVHRDIKPHNIMMEAGHAVVADFGIAIDIDTEPADRLTSPGLSPGTPHYMSPEQFTGDRRLDGRSDIYSLGCVLYEMIAGDPPFTGSSVDAIRARKLAGSIPPLRVVRPAVTDQLDWITLKCLAVSPADRFRNASELVEALKDANSELDRTTRGPLGGRSTDDGQSTSSGVRRLAIGALGVAASAIFLTTIGFLSTRAFDVKLQVPGAFAPSRTDYPIIGAKALIPVAFNSFVVVVGWILLRQAWRLLGTVARATAPAITSRVRTATGSIGSRWHGFWTRMRPAAVADTWLAGSMLISGIVIARFWPLLATLFTDETAILACQHRAFHRSFSFWMDALIMGLAFGWVGVFRWLGRRRSTARGVAVARWGSVALIAGLLLIVSTPWRLFWAADTERVLIDGDRAYVLVETTDDLVVYMPDRRTTEVRAKALSDGILRKHINGYVFEERSAFESNQAGCRSITRPE